MGKYRFKQPAPFTAGLPAFNQQTDLSQLVTQIGVPMMQGFAGQGGFMPMMSPAQGHMDQHAMSAHQRNMQANTYNTSAMGNDQVTQRLISMASAVAGQPLSDMSKQQAAFAASALNHPVTKGFLGSVMGPENLEGILHGQKGDVSALAASTNRIGYFRKGPSGKGRMSADEMSDFSKDMYRELYEPDGNVGEMVSGAAAGKAASVKQLQKAAGKEHLKFVKNADITTRLTTGADEEETTQKQKEVSRLYKKYVSGGEATDVKEQAAAVTKIDRAVAESNVLKRDETSVGQLKTAAETASRRGMQGFSAGQAAGIQDDLYERGMLPKALGAMTPAERVKMIQQNTPRDDASMTAMARDYGHKELMKDKSYAKLDSTDQSKRLDDELKTFKTKLADTLKEVDKTSSGAKGARSAVSVEGLGGMDVLGSRVDAKRSGAALKSYAGAVAAVREIFGANGNSNAPMPMLLAALDGLSGGAMGQVSSAKIETSLREMNTAAKNAGVGFEELNALSANMQAEGDMRGTAKNVTMQNTVTALSASQVMRDEGAFSKPRTGAFTQAEALEATKNALQSGTASTNARAMGANVQIYNDDPQKYAGTLFEAKIKAYQGDGNYSHEVTDATGKKTTITGNINEDMARGQYGAAQKMATDAGIKRGDFNTAYADKHSREYINPTAQLEQQRISQKLIVANKSSAFVRDHLLGDKPGQTKDGDEAQATAGIITPALTDLAFKAAENQRDRPEQLEFIQKEAEGVLTKAFEKNGQTPAQAAASAKKAVAAMELNTGAGAGRLKTQTDAAIQTTGGVLGENTEQLGQTATKAQLDAQNAKTNAAAAANKRLQEALGANGNPLGRLGDYLESAGQGNENITVDNVIKSLTGTLGPNETTDALYKKAIPAMINLKESYDDHAVTDKYLKNLTTKGDKGLAELRERAEIGPGLTIETKKERDKAYSAHLKGLSDEDVTKQYLRDELQGKTKTTGVPVAQQRAALLKNTDGQAAIEFDKARYAPGTKRVSEATALEKAGAKDVGTAQGRTPEEKAAHKLALEKIQIAGRGLSYASNESFAAEGMAAMSGLLLGEKGTDKTRDKLAADMTAAVLEADETKSGAGLDKAIKGLTPEKQKEARDYVAGARNVKQVNVDPGDTGLDMGPAAATHKRSAAAPMPQNTKMSDEQKKLIKEIQDAKPADKEALIKGKLSDKDSRELLLTLPDADMREMYSKLPEDQKKSTADNIGMLGTPGGLLTQGGRSRVALGIPDEDVERFARVHDVITKPAPEKTASKEKPADAAAAAEASATTTPAAAAADAIPVAAEQAAGTIAEAIIAAAETAAATLAKLTDGGLKGSSGHSDSEKTPAGEPAATPAQLADADVKEDAPLPSVEPTGIIPPTSAQEAKAITSESRTAADVDEDAYGLNDPEAMRRLDQDIATMKAGKAADPKYDRDTRLLGKATADRNYNERNRGQKLADKLPQTGSDTRTGVLKQGELQRKPDRAASGDARAASFEESGLVWHSAAGGYFSLPGSDELKERTDAGLTKTSGLSSDETETPVTQSAAPMATDAAQATQADTLKIPELMQTLASIGPNNIRAATAGTATDITASVESAAGPSGGGGGGGGGSTQPLKLTGTLSMQGLTSAIINAQAQTPIQTEGGGAPIMPDGPQSRARSPIENLAPRAS